MQDEYRTRAKVGEDGRLTLEHLPFAAGDEVEVTISPRAADAAGPTFGTLKGTVQHYGEPMEPVEEHEWDVLE
ncbi:MAG TPA: hypothetical protein VFR81_13305 [Longimicrobium sp.]|nr:hypothetical protein [Longimicrobium sp.]